MNLTAKEQADFLVRKLGLVGAKSRAVIILHAPALYQFRGEEHWREVLNILEERSPSVREITA